MKEFKTWTWGFIPAIAVLGLIWFEFWQSGHMHRAPLTPAPALAPDGDGGPATDAASQPVKPENPATAVVVAVTPGTPVTPAAPAISPPLAAPADGLDARMFTEPPPISLNVKDANLTDLAQALGAALGDPTSVTAASQGAARYSLEIKDKPLWDVFQTLQDQTPFYIVDGPGLRLAPADNTQGGIRHFQRHGPAILFARSLSYTRSASAPGMFSLTLGAVIDPRLKVIRHAPILILDAQDETGRVQSIPEPPVGDNMQAHVGNFWMQGVSWPANGAAAKNITLHCEVRFAVETALSAPTVAVEDAANKTGQVVAVRDQQVRIERFSFDGSRISVQLAPAQGGSMSVSLMVFDASGKSFGNTTTPALTANFAGAGAQAPFRLVLHGVAGEPKTLSYQFELPEIPVP